jgi:hypothetical protein
MESNLHSEGTDKSPQTPARPISPSLSTPTAGAATTVTPSPASGEHGTTAPGGPLATSSGGRAVIFHTLILHHFRVLISRV